MDVAHGLNSFIQWKPIADKMLKQTVVPKNNLMDTAVLWEYLTDKMLKQLDLKILKATGVA
jgi:hypothetical protein